MGPLLVLVSPCFRENVIVTCKIVSFLCSLDNFLLKNVIIFLLLEIIFQNGAHLKRRLLWTHFSHFFGHQGKIQKFLQHISHLHNIYTILLTLLTFCHTNFAKNTVQINHVWFLFGMTPGVVILFRAILE